jgi:hypothetical protein
MPAGGIAAHFRPSVAQPASGKAARSRSAVMLTAAGAEVFKVLSGRAHAGREIDDFERRCLVGDERVQRQCGLCKSKLQGSAVRSLVFRPGGACKPALPRQLMLIWAFTIYPGCHGQRWSQSTACHFAATACCASRSDRIHVITCR